MNTIPSRRQFLRASSALVIAGFVSSARGDKTPPEGFRSLFDGKTLSGWHPMPRPQGGNAQKAKKSDDANSFYERSLKSRGRWTVQDGVIVGEQDPPGSGLGGYLVSDEAFGDFELLIEARPAWPVDTGVLVRTAAARNVGFQVLIDHRPHGGIGGFYGNGLGSFHAWAYGFTGETDEDGHLTRLVPEKPAEPNRTNITIPLDFAAPAEAFLRAWKLNDWNQIRIRSVGELPQLTTWINGEKIAELDTAKIEAPGYDAKAVLGRIGRSGHIALEVHSNGRTDPLGQDRWAPGAVCRWRNIYIKPLAQ